MFNRKQVADAATEIAEHLKVVDNIKALQAAQKDLSVAIATLGERIRDIEISIIQLKSDIRVETLKETQSIVNSVQGGLNSRIQDLAISVALIENKRVPNGSAEGKMIGNGVMQIENIPGPDDQ
ncbi:hypothetical protein AB9F35_32260 [Rhizobium leguminosarum]|uniref:hypothetical protein n=1 Tax=Rhizobium leguminosarum TaxID=384 RepID=UPI003F951C61